jgi:probable HAF family extracellular repeat protein
MNKILANCISLGIGLGAIGVAFPAQAASFQGLGDLPGGIFPFPGGFPGGFRSEAMGISADGSTVVGSSESANGKSEAFRWTQATGMVGLGGLPGGGGPLGIMSESRGVSSDGSVVVGGEGGLDAFRWTQATGMVGLGTNSGGANGGSSNGSVVVGFSYVPDGVEAFRWTQATGIVGLGDLPGGGLFSNAYGVSFDGSVVVGVSGSASGDEPFRWTQATGIVGLGDLPGGGFRGEANAVSGDGSVIVGFSDSANGLEAFRWTQATGMVGLGDLPGGGFGSFAFGASQDGSVVVGLSEGASGQRAFIWDATNGMRDLQEVLVNDFGLDLTGWHLSNARAISANGLTIAGSGGNPNGQLEAWIANLSPTGTTPTNPLLPTPNPSNPDGFTFPGVIIGDNGLGIINPIFFDPIVSVGYDYAVTGGPLFASVLIPNALPQGDSNFILELPGFGNYSLVAGTTFNLLGVNPLGFRELHKKDDPIVKWFDKGFPQTTLANGEVD